MSGRGDPIPRQFLATGDCLGKSALPNGETYRSVGRFPGEVMLGAAVIGLGIGEQHITGFRRPPKCDVLSVCDLSPDKLRQFKQLSSGIATTTRWRDLLQDDRLHIISIASFDDVHFEQALAALESGRHVFVEKPLCRSPEELTALAAALRNRPQLKLASNLVLRTAPAYRWLRNAIREGLFGEIYAFDGDYLFGRIHKITQGWRKDVHEYSVMQGGGVHLVDLMMWLTGQLPESVVACGNQIATRGTAFRQRDFVAATFTFPSGLIGRITANFGCVQPHQHVVRVFGTKATFVYDDQGPRWFASRDPGRSASQLDMSPLPATKWELIPSFIESALSETSGWNEAQREFHTMSACFAADEALATGIKQEIEYV